MPTFTWTFANDTTNTGTEKGKDIIVMNNFDK